MRNFNAKKHPYIQQVLARADQDAAFRARLLQHPHAAIKEETGIDVPPGFALRFVRQPGGNSVTAHFPERSEESDTTNGDPNLEDELSLDDLEAAAGGTGGTPGDDPESPW